MHPARDLSETLASYYSDWGVTGLRLVGEGLENWVYRADSRALGPIAIRVPRQRVYQNDNDEALEARRLLQQEADLARHMRRHGVPAPEVYALHFGERQDFLVSAFVESDRSVPDPRAMGALTRAIHACPVPPGFRPVAHGGRPLSDVLAERIARRGSVVERLAGVRLALPQLGAMARILDRPDAVQCILHMDMRPANLLTRMGTIAAVVDCCTGWTRPSCWRSSFFQKRRTRPWPAGKSIG